MSRKRLSTRRQNELASMPDPDLPMLKVFVTENCDNTDNVGVVDLFDGETGVVADENLIVAEDDESDNEVSIYSPIASNESDGSIMIEHEEVSLRDKLRSIAVDDGMCLSTVTKLLHALHQYHPELPLDARTLLQTPVKQNIRSMGDGRYCHLGLKAGLQSVQQHFSTLESEPLKLLFNIDGLPITKGGQQNFWPILCSVTNVKCDVIPVGIYEGQSKPCSFNSFLEEFVAELNDLVEHGLDVNGVSYTIQIEGFIMDAPATASTICVAPFNAYNGCRKCCATGQYHGKIVFPETLCALRTDKSFRNRENPAHHTGFSEL